MKPTGGWVSYVASALAALTTALIVAVMGAPIWATFGFGIVTFYIFRFEDRSQEKP